MAKKSLIAKAKRKPQFGVRGYNRCFVCGRPRGYMRRFAPVPHLLPGARPAGRAARRDEVELVGPMNISDPIADMLTRIRNAQPRAPHRGARAGLAHQARDRPDPEGRGLHRRVRRGAATAPTTVLRLALKYVAARCRSSRGLKRVSKPGLRVYAAKTDIPRVLGGLGVVIVSTSHGIMTGAQARKAQLGGEVLAYVW